MKPVCVKCQRFFRPKHTGHFFVEGMPNKPGALPGTAEPEHWSPYKLWIGDLWECQGCGAEIISGVGRGPVAEHYQDDFPKQTHGVLQVNDC